RPVASVADQQTLWDGRDVKLIGKAMRAIMFRSHPEAAVTGIFAAALPDPTLCLRVALDERGEAFAERFSRQMILFKAILVFCIPPPPLRGTPPPQAGEEKISDRASPRRSRKFGE